MVSSTAASTGAGLGVRGEVAISAEVAAGLRARRSMRFGRGLLVRSADGRYLFVVRPEAGVDEGEVVLTVDAVLDGAAFGAWQDGGRIL